MTAVTRALAGSWVLQTWLYRTVLESFEPNVEFYNMGEKPMFEDWYNTVSCAKFSS